MFKVVDRVQLRKDSQDRDWAPRFSGIMRVKAFSPWPNGGDGHGTMCVDAVGVTLHSSHVELVQNGLDAVLDDLRPQNEPDLE
jgi:hypothetical protein